MSKPKPGELPVPHECDVCGRKNHEAWKACRFEVACSCWYGIPCKGRKR